MYAERELEREVSRVTAGSHLCLVYEDESEQLAAVVPYVKTGLGRGERCVYIADDRSVEEIEVALARAGVDVAREHRRGALRIMTKRETYLASGVFDPEAMIALLRDETECALADGFTGLCITGEMTWALGPETGNERIVEYESRLNLFFPGSRAHAICQYNRRRFHPATIRDVLRTHPIAVVGGLVCPNVFYEPPDMTLGHRSIAEEVAWRIEQLKTTRAAAMALERSAEEERRALVKTVDERSAELESLLSNAPIGVASFDRVGRFHHVNARLAELDGVPASAHIGRSIRDVCASVAPAMESALLHVLETGEPVRDVEVVAELPERLGGHRRWQVSLYPVCSADGTLLLVGAVILDVTEQRRAEDALAEQLALTRAITANATAGLFMVDEEGRCLFMNSAAEAMTGYAFEELRGRPLHDAIRGCLPDVYIRKGGELFPGVCVATPIRKGGKARSSVIELRDVTEQKRAEHEREMLLDRERAARAEAERANRLKDEFVATTSHELRTPLNAVLGWASLLQRPSMSRAQITRGLASIERNARALAQIVSDLLDVSRIASGKLRLELCPVDVRAALANALDGMRDAVAAKGVELHAALAPVGDRVLGDAGRLEQVFWNLVSNAIKFTPRGGRVDVSLTRVGQHVEISVSDTGQGIDPSFLPNVFERFRQADASPARQHGGLGLGLAIVKQLVELHGGDVHAESAGLGKGARFTVALPLATAPLDHHLSPRGARRDISKLKGVKVLAVEDEPDALELVQRIFEQHGAAVLAIRSSHEAIAAVAEHHPDILVSDIGLPGMDGYELIRRIRADLPGDVRDLPAVALTAFARSEDRERAMAAGFQAHVAKPIEPAELATVVAGLLPDRAHPRRSTAGS
jgi:PAS domain S-box-containing protein